MQRAKKSFLMLFLISLAILSSCGKKAPPQPPELNAPSRVRFLDVKPGADLISFSWQAPLTEASGDPLRDLAGFLVKKNVYIRGKKPSFIDIGLRVFDADNTNVENSPTFNFIDKDVRIGSVYQYMVVPFNEDDIEGEDVSVITIEFNGTNSTINRF